MPSFRSRPASASASASTLGRWSRESSAGTKFSYDLWGDTVNTASRMQSHAAPGTIQVTERTYRRLEAGYALERRTGVVVKGKGEMTTYVLQAAPLPR